MEIDLKQLDCVLWILVRFDGTKKNHWCDSLWSWFYCVYRTNLMR